MAAADQAEGHGGVDEAAAGDNAGGRAAGVHIVDGIGVLTGGGGADGAVLGLEGHMDALRQIVGDQGGQTDAQVDHIAVLQLLGHAGGDKTFDLRLFH